MMIRKYYIDDDPGGGGGGNPPAAPKGYAVTTPQQRTDWNDFLDYAAKQPGANLKDPKAQTALLSQYKKANPSFSITAEQIPNIQYEAYQLRKGDKFGNLGAKELGYIRQGLSPNYINADISNVGKLYYPQMASHGTDLEGYYNAKFNPSAAPVASQPGNPVGAPPVVVPTTSVMRRTDKSDAYIRPQNTRLPAAYTAAEQTTAPPGGISRPDYGDPESRLKFAAAYQKKHGTEEGYGDIPLRVNERPYLGNDTSKNMAVAASKSTGLDPALVYASSLVEGAAAMYPNKEGKASYGNDPDYPVQGSAFGLNQFYDRVPEMIKKGYLPKDFDTKKYVPTEEEISKNPNVTKNSGLFKNFQDAMTAHAARLKLDYDEIEDYAKEKDIKLSPQARDFFSLAHFNSGLGKQMLDKYNKNGWLKGDQFLKGNPDGSYPEVYKHVILRIKERNALKNEQLFDN